MKALQFLGHFLAVMWLKTKELWQKGAKLLSDFESIG
jgi:hypothetical protein